MNSFIIYLLESGLCLLILFILYQVFLKRETYYQLNRVYLLSSLIFSLVVPLLNINLTSQSPGQMANFLLEPILVSATGGAIASTKQIGIFEVFGVIYFLVVLFLVARLLLNFRRITKLYSTGRVITDKHYKLILHSMNYPPFSFFNKIFISEMHYSGEQLDDIIVHEKAHVRQLHSVDLVLAEMLIILQWFNPMAWYFKNMLTENHEFLADEAVLNRGFNPESYQLRILTQLFGILSMSAVHNFNQSVTQKRLKMMEKSRSTAASRLKLLLVLPTAMLLFYMFACTSSEADLSTQDTPETSTKTEVYFEVDEHALPDGGVETFRKHIAQNLRYPEEAYKNGVGGKVVIQFIVDENGTLVTTVENSEVPSPSPPRERDASGNVLPPPTPPEKVASKGVVVTAFIPLEEMDTEYSKEDMQLLADEAVRVIIESDIKWKPAMKDGKPVKSALTFPITFRLK